MRTYALLISGAMLLLTAANLRAGFDGPYAVTNWTLVNSNANGSIDTSSAPNHVRLIGGNNLSYNPGWTEWTITAAEATTIQFDWIYFTQEDDSGPFDRAGWLRGTNRFELGRNDRTNRTGRVTVNLIAGETFGFWVFTSDNLVFPGELIITNFSHGLKPPAFRCASISNNVVLLDFHTIPGQTYRVEGTTVLPGTNWSTVVSSFVATTTQSVVSVSTTNSANLFFRAVLVP